jgi:DNA-directed RNA polymerase specialized sigma subunit
MTPLEIQFELKKKEVRQKEIARELKVSEMTVSRVINKQLVSDRVMKAVAGAIKRDHRAVFPEYYFGPKRRTTSNVA